MPDQDTTPEPPKRMTTAEAARTAQDAMALATSVAEDVERLGEKFTELDQRVRDGAGTTTDPADVIDSEGKPVLTRDQVDSRIHEALEPLHLEVHELRQKGTLTPESKGSLAGVLARLEDAERKLMPLDAGALTEQVATALHPSVAELRRRLSALEELAEAQEADPASHTLAEDYLSDVLAQVALRMDDVEARSTQIDRDIADLRQHVEMHGTRVTQAIVNQVAEELQRRGTRIEQGSVASATNGTGAATKVLELMRLVTHIGKEKEANLGKGGRFKFRGVDDAMDAVGHAMREVGLILSTKILHRETNLTPVTQQGSDNGKPWERTVVWATSVVTAQYTFTDPVDGSTHPFEMVGEGRDSSDKSTSKATSMALKYGLFQALMIPVTGLDDADDAPPQQMVNQRPVNQEPQPEPPAAPTEEQRAHRAGEALAAIRNLHRVPRAEQYNRLVQIMNQVKQEGLLEFVVEGSTLNQHGLAATATLRQQGDQDKQAPPPDDARASTEPPEPPEDYR